MNLEFELSNYIQLHFDKMNGMSVHIMQNIKLKSNLYYDL